MSVAEAVTPSEEVSAPADVSIQGRVDALDGGRLFGWVWDRAKPTDRLGVRVVLDGVTVATAIADKPRIDLRRNGIGDGAYAFDVTLAPDIAANGNRLSVIAVTPDGVEIALRNPTVDERAAEAAVAAPMARVLERLDLLVAAQRQTLLGQRESSQLLQDAAKRFGSHEEDEPGDIARRLGELEIFLVRFDATLRGFDTRLKTLSERDGSQLKPLLLVFAALGGVAAGVIASLAVGI